MPNTTGKTVHFVQCFSSPLSPDKLQPPPSLDMFIWNGDSATDDRYIGNRHLTILLLQQPVNVINDEAPWGCRRMASAAAFRHWLIEWERKTQCRKGPWHGRDDKNIITAATASKLSTTNYAPQLCTALVSHSQIALLPASQGHKEKEFIEKRFMSMWLMQESYFSL